MGILFCMLIVVWFLGNWLRVVRQNRFALCQSMQIALRDTTRIRFGKAGAHPQLAWESQLPLKPYLSLQPSDFEGNCDSSDFLLDFRCSFSYSFYLLCKCGLLAHTSPAFLKNCWIKKLFVCLRLAIFPSLTTPQKSAIIRNEFDS